MNEMLEVLIGEVDNDEMRNHLLGIKSYLGPGIANANSNPEM